MAVVRIMGRGCIPRPCDGTAGGRTDGELRLKNPEAVSDRFSQRVAPVNYGTHSSHQTPPLA